MASSIIGGLIARDFKPEHIFASDPNNQALTSLRAAFGIQICATNQEAVASADVVVLAVKPQVMAQVCQALAPSLQPGTLIISIAAGITCASLRNWLGAQTAIVRCMPNTPALVQMGASGLYATDDVSAVQKAQAAAILEAVGIVHWVSTETLIDSVTAISGSGPAYFFLMMEAMVAAACEQGLDANTATALAVQTAAGAAKLAQQSDVDLAELRRRVTSPGGTTEQAIQSFETNGYRQIVAAAMQACKRRAEEMAQEMGKNT